jgi:hypothetical protein
LFGIFLSVVAGVGFLSGQTPDGVCFRAETHYLRLLALLETQISCALSEARKYSWGALFKSTRKCINALPPRKLQKPPKAAYKVMLEKYDSLGMGYGTSRVI